MDERVSGPGTSVAHWLDPAKWGAWLYLSGCNRVGAGTRVLGRPLVYNQGRIDIGRGCTLRSLGSPVRLTTTAAGTITIGDGALLDVGSNVYAQGSVRIEDGVVLGPHAIVSDTDERGRAGDVVIESLARIGAGARVIGPCRIGRAAVVQPGSIVHGDVAPGAVVRTASNGVGDAPVGRPPGAVDAAPKANGVSPAAAAHSPQARHVSAVLAADFTIDELAGPLAVPEYDGIVMDVEVAPYDQVVPTLMALKSRATKPDVLVAWTRPDHACPSFRDLLWGGRPDVKKVLGEVDAFASIIKAHGDAGRFVFVPSWVLPPGHRGVGLLGLRDAQATNLLMRMNLLLADTFADSSNIFLLDAQRWLAVARDGGYDPKLWHAGKVAFTTDVLSEAARDIFAATRGVLGMSRKLVVVDLDDTMWGGIVGDVGWEGLHLGGHDPSGEAFVDFQRQLLALTKRGIALAVVSKNEESTALEAMKRHPEMVIRPEMLAAYRINWRDKAQNIVEIAKELNLGLQSVVFLDDNPVERGRVREALPEVYVPDWPSDPTSYPTALASMTCLDSAHLSAEDLERNAMYATERERSSLRSRVSTIDEWLATLGLVVRFEPFGKSNVARITQLLNKTNQMNLRTRRMTEAELTAWAEGAGREVWAVQVADRFGEAGLTGILSLSREAEDVHVEDYVLSCRVMGRRVEETMVWAAKRRAAALGGSWLRVSPVPTAKNKPCLDFFASGSLAKEGDGYRQPLAGNESAPPLVTVEGL